MERRGRGSSPGRGRSRSRDRGRSPPRGRSRSRERARSPARGWRQDGRSSAGGRAPHYPGGEGSGGRRPIPAPRRSSSRGRPDRSDRGRPGPRGSSRDRTDGGSRRPGWQRSPERSRDGARPSGSEGGRWPSDRGRQLDAARRDPPGKNARPGDGRFEWSRRELDPKRPRPPSSPREGSRASGAGRADGERPGGRASAEYEGTRNGESSSAAPALAAGSGAVSPPPTEAEQSALLRSCSCSVLNELRADSSGRSPAPGAAAEADGGGAPAPPLARAGSRLSSMDAHDSERSRGFGGSSGAESGAAARRAEATAGRVEASAGKAGARGIVRIPSRGRDGFEARDSGMNGLSPLYGTQSSVLDELKRAGGMSQPGGGGGGLDGEDAAGSRLDVNGGRSDEQSAASKRRALSSSGRADADLDDADAGAACIGSSSGTDAAMEDAGAAGFDADGDAAGGGTARRRDSHPGSSHHVEARAAGAESAGARSSSSNHRATETGAEVEAADAEVVSSSLGAVGRRAGSPSSGSDVRSPDDGARRADAAGGSEGADLHIDVAAADASETAAPRETLSSRVFSRLAAHHPAGCDAVGGSWSGGVLSSGDEYSWTEADMCNGSFLDEPERPSSPDEETCVAKDEISAMMKLVPGSSAWKESEHAPLPALERQKSWEGAEPPAKVSASTALVDSSLISLLHRSKEADDNRVKHALSEVRKMAASASPLTPSLPLLPPRPGVPAKPVAHQTARARFGGKPTRKPASGRKARPAGSKKRKTAVMSESSDDDDDEDDDIVDDDDNDDVDEVPEVEEGRRIPARLAVSNKAPIASGSKADAPALAHEDKDGWQCIRLHIQGVPLLHLDPREKSAAAPAAPQQHGQPSSPAKTAAAEPKKGPINGDVSAATAVSAPSPAKPRATHSLAIGGKQPRPGCEAEASESAAGANGDVARRISVRVRFNGKSRLVGAYETGSANEAAVPHQSRGGPGSGRESSRPGAPEADARGKSHEEKPAAGSPSAAAPTASAKADSSSDAEGAATAAKPSSDGDRSTVSAASSKSGSQLSVATTLAATSRASAPPAEAAGSSSGDKKLKVPSHVVHLQEEGQHLKRQGDKLEGLQQAWHYVSASLKYMQAAFLLERQQREGSAAVSKAQQLYAQCSDFWKRPTAQSLEGCDQYLMAALCYECASACAMRAFRLRQRECAKAVKRARDELRQAEAAAPKNGSNTASTIALSSQTNAKLQNLLSQLGYACTMLEDYDKGTTMRRAMGAEAPEEQRAKLPALESFAALTTKETLERMQILLPLLKEAERAQSEDS